jgi:glycosyltransferase involved in cell wall biosynthesis
VQACTALKRRLKVIGTGPELEKLKRVAGPTVEFLGWQTDDQIARELAHARAFIFSAIEDFGIVVVEAQAAGCPVIALGQGGALETVIGLHNQQSRATSTETAAIRPTGVHFERQTVYSVMDALQHFEENSALFGQSAAQACRDNAMRFTTGEFDRQFRLFAQ